MKFTREIISEYNKDKKNIRKELDDYIEKSKRPNESLDDLDDYFDGYVKNKTAVPKIEASIFEGGKGTDYLIIEVLPDASQLTRIALDGIVHDIAKKMKNKCIENAISVNISDGDGDEGCLYLSFYESRE